MGKGWGSHPIVYVTVHVTQEQQGEGHAGYCEALEARQERSLQPDLYLGLRGLARERALYTYIHLYIVNIYMHVHAQVYTHRYNNIHLTHVCVHNIHIRNNIHIRRHVLCHWSVR